MSTENTQLTYASGYNTDNITFSDPIQGGIPNTTIKFQRIMIGTKNPDGTKGELILSTRDPNDSNSEMFSFGLSENRDPGTDKINGYTIPVCLHKKDGPTDYEKAFTETFENIVEACKDHILSVKDDIGQYDLEKSDLKKLNPLYYKKENGKRVEGLGPTLYAKVIESKKQGKILTQVFDYQGNPINPHDLKGKYCYGKFAVKIESIFIGNKISLQVKMYEAEVRISDGGMKRLLSRPAASTNIVMPSNNDDDDDVSVDGGDSLAGSDSEEEIKPQPKKVVKKVIKRKVVKK